MRNGSVLELDRYDLTAANRGKNIEDIEPDDFREKATHELIKHCSIVLFNEYDEKVPSSIIRTIIFKNKYGLKGEVK